MATVDFGSVATTFTTAPFGSAVSTYGSNNITVSATSRDLITSLKLDSVRIPIMWGSGSPKSGANGTDNPGISGMTWVDTVISMGITPVVVCCGDGGSDNAYTSAEFANLVTYFGTKCNNYIIGNEPDGEGLFPTPITAAIQSAAVAMKAARPGIKIWAPALAHMSYSTGAMDTFWATATSVDGWNYHAYGQGIPPSKTTLDMMALTPTYNTKMAESKARMTVAGKTSVPPLTGEYNWAFQYLDGEPGGDQRFFQSANAVWIASVQGHIMKGGGRGYNYADINGPLGLLTQAGHADSNGKPAGTPQPSYWGLAAWTGAGIWPKAGTTSYTTTTSESNLEAWAVNNAAGGKNIILLNKHTATSHNVTTTISGYGAFTEYVIYKYSRLTPYAAPSVTATGTHSGTITTTVDYLSYAVIVLSDVPGGTPPEPTTSRTLYKVDVGGTDNADGWLGDSPFASGGTVGSVGGTVTSSPSDVPARIFQSERWGPVEWTFIVKPGVYSVRVMASEQFSGVTGNGQRTFDVLINDMLVVAGVDLYRHTYAKVWHLRSMVLAETGVITVRTRGDVGAPTVNGIWIDDISSRLSDLS